MSMEKRRPQLNLDELNQLRWLLGGTLVLLSVWTVFYLDFEAWTMMGLTTVAVIATLVRPRLPGLVPALAHRLAFPAVVLFFLGDLWITGQVLPAIVRLDILLLLYRGTSYRQKRDDLQVIILGLFLIVVAGVLTVSLAFAAQILVFTACALAFLFVITLSEATETAPAKPVAAGAPAWTHLGWRRLFGRLREVADGRVIALAAGLFVGVVGLTALLFLAIPRFQFDNSLFLERFVSKKARTGFNDTIKFGDVTEIQLDDSVALSVDVTDRAQIPAAPYWRMLVLDEYRNGTFKLSPVLWRSAFTPEFTSSQVRGAARSSRGEPVYWTFYLESGVSRYLPLLGTFEHLRFRETQNYRQAPNLGMVSLREEPAAMTAYRVDGMNFAEALPDANFALKLQDGRPTGRFTKVQHMLSLGVGPEDLATLGQAVKEITGGAQLPAAEFADRARVWLVARHKYSLTPNIPAGGGDPLVRWLMSRESGHCELFAGSLVLLARAAGLPARVVTGFRGGTWNAYSSNFTIRNSDAHAWCEIFDRTSAAWLREDPTPGGVAGPAAQEKGEATLARRMDRGWTAWWNSLRIFWYRRIVNFDQRTQTESLRAVKEATQNSGKQLRVTLSDALDRVKAWLTEPWSTRRVINLLAALALLAGAGWAWHEFGRDRWRGWRGQKTGIDPVRAQAGRWLRELSSAPKSDSAAKGVVADLQRLRFGARGTWSQPEPVFRRARMTVKRMARR